MTDDRPTGFPTNDLLAMAARAELGKPLTATDAATIRDGVRAYEALSDRFLAVQTELRAHRARHGTRTLPATAARVLPLRPVNPEPPEAA
jgi:hypothetical protein